VPVALTEKVTDSPTDFVALAGWLKIEGGVSTVSVAGADVTDPHELFTTTSYEAASPVATELMVYELELAPVMPDPFFRH